MPPSDTPNQRLASHVLGEPVASWIRARRPVRKTWRQIAAELRTATAGQVDVSIQTLINWAPDPPDEDEAEPGQPAARAS